MYNFHTVGQTYPLTQKEDLVLSNFFFFPPIQASGVKLQVIPYESSASFSFYFFLQKLPKKRLTCRVLKKPLITNQQSKMSNWEAGVLGGWNQPPLKPAKI